MRRQLLRCHCVLALRSQCRLPPLLLLAFLLSARRVSAQQYGDSLGCVLLAVCATAAVRVERF